MVCCGCVICLLLEKFIMAPITLFWMLLCLATSSSSMIFHQGGYNQLQVALAPQIPVPANCSQMLHHLEVSFLFVFSFFTRFTCDGKKPLEICTTSFSFSFPSTFIFPRVADKRSRVSTRVDWDFFFFFGAAGHGQGMKLFPPVRILSSLRSFRGG